jgi:hypothetical protein
MPAAAAARGEGACALHFHWNGAASVAGQLFFESLCPVDSQRQDAWCAAARGGERAVGTSKAQLVCDAVTSVNHAISKH